MQKKTFAFSVASTTCYFDGTQTELKKLLAGEDVVFVTDQHLFDNQPKWFKGARTIVLPPGESSKAFATVESIIGQLIAFEADRKTLLVGVGGGVVTDLAGFAGSVYMRGIRFGFVPTTILAMVDASIGGKNGIDIGGFKNLVGAIRQPEFLFYDSSLLSTLPQDQWVNGFAEVIKHAAIVDPVLFRELEKNSLAGYRKNRKALSALIRKNVLIKTRIVQKDEFESGDRKLLNFGHTLGHAVENLYQLPHGHAVSIGIKAACLISEELLDFRDTARVMALLAKYGLPTDIVGDAGEIMAGMRLDKKKARGSMNYVLLPKIGKAVVKSIPMPQLEKLVYSITRAR
jgi:shikimate kinase / 3-dehydroquinate synthase